MIKLFAIGLLLAVACPVSASMHSVQDYQTAANMILAPGVRDYINGGAGDEMTLHANCSQFSNYLIVPPVLSLRSLPDCSTTILGKSVAMPICIAPTAFHKLAHPDGELATSMAAQRAGSIYVISSFATVQLAQLREQHDDMSHVWVKLLAFKNREFMHRVIQHAEQLGCGAIVITVDAPVSGKKRAMGNQFALPEGVDLELLREHDFFDDASGTNEALHNFFTNHVNQLFSWDDVKAIVRSTHLPVVLKGILRPEDAQHAYECGVRGIIVSNHGGRQLDGTLPTLSALKNIMEQLAVPLEVYVDGGVRTGADVFKALALGARAVFIGRPVLWGLAVDGQQGVHDVLTILKQELLMTMSLAGTARVNEIPVDVLRAQ